MFGAPMQRDRFQKITGVSAATVDRLARYEALLIKWQKAINLVGPKTLTEIWERHFLDSAQFWAQTPATATSLADVGSGGGFPGLVLAAVAADEQIGRPGLQPPFHVHLIESDQRKATFLREAAREMGLHGAAVGVTVHAKRIEAMTDLTVDVVTARACAPLSQLLAWTQPMLSRGAVGLFAKGAQAEDEIAGVTGYRIDRIPSATDPAGCLLVVNRLPEDGISHDAAA
jgi:16S rRNA (guanine527-N7)-methyltransferase